MDKKKKMLLIIDAIAIVIVVGIFCLLLNKNDKTMYTVTFDTDGGSVVEKVQVEEDSTVGKPTDPTKEGYTFVEWTLNGKKYNFSKKVVKNITLKATWEELEKDEVSVIFDSQNGSNTETIVLKKGEKVSKPTDPTKEGYTFVGWLLNGQSYDFNKEITENITLVASWEAKKVENKTTKTTTKTTTNNNSTNNSTNNNSSSNANTNNNSGNTNKPVQPKAKYTVSFNSNGGSAVSSQTIESGSKATKPANPTKSGYTFQGWTLNGSNFDFNTSITGNITLVAKWTQKSYVVKVSIVDQYSPARILSVYENGTKITFKEIQYTDGVTVCSGTNPNVNVNALTGETSLLVVLNDGTKVTASIS